MDLPLYDGLNAICTCVDPLTKYFKLIHYFLGEGALSASSVAKLFLDNLVRFFGIPAEVNLNRDPRFTASFW